MLKAMTTRRRHGAKQRFSTRPFLVSTAVLLTLTAVHGLGRLAIRDDDHDAVAGLARLAGRQTTDAAACRLVRQARDQCGFVRTHCRDEAAGLLPYLTFYYCTVGRALQPVGFAVLVLWLGLLFTTIGIAASDFFSVNLGTIASLLGLSESLAGVTFLAFGNGSPDVFSTFAAMGSNSGSMAVGELIGAASFITAVVAGSMALVREFRVSRYTFVRDICFFIVAVAFAVVFLADGRLRLWECCTMIAFYVFYVFTVVSWHWVVRRRKRRRVRDAGLHRAAGRSSSSSSSDLVVDGQPPPYRDESNEPDEPDAPDEQPDRTDGSDEPAHAPAGDVEHDDDVRSRRRQRQPSDMSILERGPRIEINSVDTATGRDRQPEPEDDDDDDDDDDDERNRHINAEMTSSMRVNRPRGRRSTAVTPIRPSLLGALEFRSVLSSLQRSGTVRLAHIDRRRASAQAITTTASGFGVSAAHALEYGGSGSSSAILPPRRAFLEPPFLAANSRGRALSSGDVPRSLLAPEDGIPDQPLPAADSSAVSAASASASASTATAAAGTPDSSSETDVSPFALPEPTAWHHPRYQPRPAPPSLHLHIPVPADRHHGSPRSSPSLSPFPGYADSPGMVSPTGPSRTSSFGLSSSASDQQHLGSGSRHPHRQHYFPVSATSDVDEADSRRTVLPKPVRWWPYGLLPPPHVILCTLFPTLQRWREKSVWDKFVSLISAPTVFLLVITLPVVEMEDELEDEEEGEGEEGEEEGDDDVEQGPPDDSSDVHYRDDVQDDPLASLAVPRRPEESEWQRYRRSTSASRMRRPTSRELLLPSPVLQAAADLEQDVAGSSTPGEQTVPLPVPGGVMTKQLPIAVTISEADSAGDGLVSNTPAAAAAAAVAAAAAEAEETAAGAWNRWLVAVQLFAGPQFTVLVVWANMEDEDDSGESSSRSRGQTLLWMAVAALAASLVMLGLLLWTTTAERRPRRHALLCFLGFVISVAWISTVAGEVVGVLKALGVVAGISEAVLGLTIFAVGNSLGDLVADITVARLGYPVMALSACFGGPMLNILLGVGIGGAWMTTRTPAAKSGTAATAGMATPPHSDYVIEVGKTLMVSAVTVLVTLVTLLVVVPANGWVMSRRIGIVLICMWVVSTTVNVVVEVAGGWATT